MASVEAGYAPRLGIVGMNNRNEIVEGIVLMRKYGDTLKTLRGVESKIHELNSSGALPTGYKAVPYYDRTELVETTLHTVMENLTIGMALVFLVLIFFLGNFRSAFIAAINIPLALLGAFILMRVGDTPANLISLGAIDFGIIINSTVIVVENVHHYLAPVEGEAPTGVSSARRRKSPVRSFFHLDLRDRFPPAVHDAGVKAAIFSPMSRTYAYALGAAILLSLALTPALASFAFERGLHQYSNPIWEAISRFYHWFFCTC